MRRINVMALLLAAMMAVPTAALAQTDEVTDAPVVTDRVHDEFAGAKRHLLAALDRRVAALEGATVRAAEAPHLTPEHLATLTADYAFHIDGLRALRPEIEAATTPGQLHELGEKLVQEHWVFALQIPKGRLTNAADIIADAASQSVEVIARFDAALAELERLGIDVDEGWELLLELETQVARAEATAAPVPRTVLSIAVSEMPAASSTIEGARQDIRSAHDSIREAHGTARELAEFIRSVIDA